MRQYERQLRELRRVKLLHLGRPLLVKDQHAALVAARAAIVGGGEDGDTPAIMQYLITMAI